MDVDRCDEKCEMNFTLRMKIIERDSRNYRVQQCVEFFVGSIDITRFLLFFFPLVLFLSATSAKTIDVGKEFSFQSLTAAIESADSGDVINVHGGVYAEGNIVINKSLSLCGIDYPVIDGKQ